MPISSQQKTVLPHEAVELLHGSNNQLAITGPDHQITTINNEELERTANTVMFSTTGTSANASVAVPTSWGQRQGILIVLARSETCLRYYGNDAAAKGADITTAPIWYRSKRPILSVMVKGVVAVLQTASEWIVLMSDAVTCREVAVHPITFASANTKTVVIQSALTTMTHGSATFIAATTSPSNTNTKHNSVAAKNIEISSFTITSSAMTLLATQTVAKTPLATAHLSINADTGIVAVPVFNGVDKSSVGISLINSLVSSAENEESSGVITSSLSNSTTKVVAVCALANKRWLIVSPVVGQDAANAEVVVISGADGSVIARESFLIGNDSNSATNRIDRKLLTTLLPSGRVVVIDGHEVHVLKLVLNKPVESVDAAHSSVKAASLATFFKAKKTTPSVTSSRLAQWATLTDATPVDVYTIMNSQTNDGSDDKVSDVVVDVILKLSDLPDLASASLSQLPFADWFRAAKAVPNADALALHSTLKVAHLVFISALRRGAISVAAIAARAFDALYVLTGDSNVSSPVAYEMKQCLQYISGWSNEQMGKQIGVVTVHCTGKSPATKQPMFVPHQPFSVSVKRHADIECREYQIERSHQGN